MSIYKKFVTIGSKYIGLNKLFKYGFNFSPMYRRSTGRVTHVSEDLYHVRIKLPISYKNINYVNSIFGGSMFSAVDPIPMVQLINILGDDFVVWDKSATISFKKPAKEILYADFNYSQKEIEDIKSQVEKSNEIEITKITYLTDVSGDQIYCEIIKILYVANKEFFKEKRRKKKAA